MEPTMENGTTKSNRLELVIAFLIAIVSLTTALAAWRTNAVGSKAGDAARLGLINAVKQQASANEDWRKLYEEAGYSESYAVALAGVKAMEVSGDATIAAQAANLREYLLPGIIKLADPLATDQKYLREDGTYNLDQRFADLQAGSPDIVALDPLASFKLSDQYSSEQRWLMIGAVLLALSLFWLALSQVGGSRLRLGTLGIGVIIYLFGLAWFLFVEVLFLILRGGAL
jgi:hypothetical protein